ncbi:hypothetical protein M5K25_027317 [Dendrobium thyrsiflorum]|uniref:NAC domain-containing protein n=1 Tax=Dendrobium thyrsiflorum TaxID=117978 RepID=A0ABD0TZJ7_DENTH
MIGEASSSRTAVPLPLPLPSSPDPTQLAPGFRFHPTDEELVSYYLKRKVTGRPIRVDAISEVDVYGAEPWELPPLSRLRSRDLEWYFFTSLGRKYSNRCRTNRATVEGYWKTTGKDRPIQSRSRTVGMKKTLVYHAGRAPRGQRTNWVMHEYRLEEENLTRSEIQQDGYVVCRIFQKTGAGPQNGAQYGAPFIEEEWELEEDVDANVVLVNEARDDALMDPGVHDFVQLGDFPLDEESSIQHVDVVPHLARSDDEDYGCHTEDPSNFLIECLEEQGSDGDLPPDADFPTIQERKTSLNRLGKQKALEYQSNSSSIQNNAYVQLKDIFGEENASAILNIESTDCFLERCNNKSFVDEMGHSEILPQNADNLDNMPSQYPSGPLADGNLVYYDAVFHEVPCLEDGLTNETSLAPKVEFDFLDELMAYYDATEDNLNYPLPDSFEPRLESSASSKVVASCSSGKDVHVRQNLEAYESLQRAPINDDPLSGWNGNLTADGELKDCQDKTLTKRLATLLNAISAPPALADEAAVISKIVGKTSAAATNTTDTVHVTAGMIQIQSLMSSVGSTESWKLQKHSEMGILLSYGISKSVGNERRMKVYGGFISSVCWVGFHIFLLGSIVLFLSYKLGICACKL